MRPVCTPCIEAGRVDDCEYTDNQGRTRTQILEENILALEARLRELEGNAQPEPSQPLALYNPYATIETSSSGVNVMQGSSDTGMASEGNTASGISLEHPWNVAWWEMDDPPVQITDTLVSVFLPHALALGFVLSPSRFRNCVGLPVDNPERPHTALINTVYLWALRISFYNQTKQHENIYLQRAILALNDPFGYHVQGANESQIAQRRIQAVQAEVLLANYFFCLGQFIEGRYHVNAAVTLALSCGLHQIRNNGVDTGISVPLIAQEMNSPLSPVVKLSAARDSNELAERINVFWAVHNIDSCWSAALGSPRFITDDVSRGTQVETHWPSKFSPERTEPQGNRESEDRQVIRGFLLSLTRYERGNNGESRFALRAKVSVLYERTARLAINGRARAVTETELQTLAQAVANFARNLTPLDEEVQDGSAHVDDIQRLLIVTHCLAHASMINLHSILVSSATSTEELERSANASLQHATEIIIILEMVLQSSGVTSDVSHATVFDPILAIVGTSVAKILIDEKHRALSIAIQEPTANTRLEHAQTLLTRLKNAMLRCAGAADNYLIFSQQIRKIEELE